MPYTFREWIYESRMKPTEMNPDPEWLSYPYCTNETTFKVYIIIKLKEVGDEMERRIRYPSNDPNEPDEFYYGEA